ncbi:putative endoplasmic reticulum protein [Naematelia encephala]|uniref:ER membrane protein complex subunit 4 n=1 Tax=Naematelia encephala TaxID=71784 RepID=A0A1Y2BGW6_9TREE|nr:putative endoplasmic reticulum protein [Naematelia encephala]
MSIKLNYTLSHPLKNAVPNPPGFLSSSSTKDISKSQPNPSTIAIQARKSTELKLRRAWELALGPAKSLPMQAIMLYFSGSGVQIFSLGMIFMLLTSPISAVLNIFKAFEAFRPTPIETATPSTTTTTTTAGKVGDKPIEASYAPLTLPMLAYVGCQGLVLALGLYKCATMGILPTGSSDWLQFETRNEPPEWSAARASSLG